jgi:hypothetical protein
MKFLKTTSGVAFKLKILIKVRLIGSAPDEL